MVVSKRFGRAGRPAGSATDPPSDKDVERGNKDPAGESFHCRYDVGRLFMDQDGKLGCN